MCRQRARQCWNSKGWRPEGLVEAAARDLAGCKSLRVWRLANGRLEHPNNRGLCAGKGQAATLEWRVLRVLRVWRLANGTLECPSNRALCAGKGQAATLEQQRLTARGLVEAAAARDLEGFKNFKCLKAGKRMPQRRVVRAWRQAWTP